jgi:hypothetical protein
VNGKGKEPGDMKSSISHFPPCPLKRAVVVAEGSDHSRAAWSSGWSIGIINVARVAGE